MLSDRDYMKSSRPAVNKTDPMKILFGIIVINALMYIIVPKPQISEGLVWIPKAYKELVLSWPGLKDGNFGQLVSSMFMHADFWHLGFNMYGLYLFGSLFVRSVGTKHFLWLYMISGVFGNMLWLMANYHSQGFLLGASGALFGVMLAAAMFGPNNQFLILFFPQPIKAKTLVMVYAAFEIFSEFGKFGGNIAHLAHLGGFIGAYIYIKIALKRHIAWDPFSFLWSRGTPKPSSRPRAGTDYKTHNDNLKNVDAILDKLSRFGANSLTDDERDVLKQAREKYKKH